MAMVSRIYAGPMACITGSRTKRSMKANAKRSKVWSDKASDRERRPNAGKPTVVEYQPRIYSGRGYIDGYNVLKGEFGFYIRTSKSTWATVEKIGGEWHLENDEGRTTSHKHVLSR